MVITPTASNAAAAAESGKSDHLRFNPDDRCLGGRQYISETHLSHQRALSSIRSVVSQQRKPPRAHIDNARGSRTFFGQDKHHIRNYRLHRQAIQERRMVNITK